MNTQIATTELTENAALLEQQRTLHEMLARSATDKEFRALMLHDPRAAFAQHGVTLPEGLDLRFVENQYDATIVLPDPIDDVLELSEAELTQLNGGSEAGSVSAVVSATVEFSSLSSTLCAGALISGGFVALTIYLAS